MPYRDFTDRIYVDFAGDDGDPAKPGASRYICMAWIVSKEEDLRYNQGIILDIKKLIGSRKDAELKYTSVKHHRNKQEALRILSEAKIALLLIFVLKERISSEELRDPSTKMLIKLIHSAPLNGILPKTLGSREYPVYFQLIFDEISWSQCQRDIAAVFKENARLDWPNARPDWLLFAKSGGNLMLQMADLMAGLGYEYLDGLKDCTLPPCVVCSLNNGARCRQLPTQNKRLLEVVHDKLIRGEGGLIWDNGISVWPTAAAREYLFLDCLFDSGLRTRRSRSK